MHGNNGHADSKKSRVVSSITNRNFVALAWVTEGPLGSLHPLKRLEEWRCSDAVLAHAGRLCHGVDLAIFSTFPWNFLTRQQKLIFT